MCRRQICEPWGYGYPAMDALSLITPIKTASSARLVQRRSANNYGEKKPLAVRTGPQRAGDRMDRGAQSPGKRAHRATVRDTARPSGEGNALGRNRYHRAANLFLELRFLPEWEQRFTVAPRNPRNAHRRLGRDQRLEKILSVRVARKVAQDHTVSWMGIVGACPA